MTGLWDHHDDGFTWPPRKDTSQHAGAGAVAGEGARSRLRQAAAPLGALGAKGEGGGPEGSATGGGFPDQICLLGGAFPAANFTLGELIFNVDSVTVCILTALKLFISSPDVSQAPVPTPYSLLSPSASTSHKPQLNHRPHAGPSRSFCLGPWHSLGWMSQEPGRHPWFLLLPLVMT